MDLNGKQLAAITALSMLLLMGCNSPTVIRGVRLPSGAETQFSNTVDCQNDIYYDLERDIFRDMVASRGKLGDIERKLHLSQLQRIEFTCPGGWEQVESHYHFWAKSHNFTEQIPGGQASGADQQKRIRLYERREPPLQESMLLYERDEYGSAMQPDAPETGREQFVLILAHYTAP